MDELLREGLALCDAWSTTHPAMASATRAILRRKHADGELNETDIERLRGGVTVTQQAQADAARA
jgi:hypothetical protein